MAIHKSPIDVLLQPVSRFIHQEHTSGIVLFASVILAIIWVNSPFQESYHHVWDINFSFGFGGDALSHPLHIWINDGLMAVFFFVIGLELKREFMGGELSSVSKASLPMVAALGGMLVPAFIYFIINRNTEAAHGWGIPMATDIAFALALVSVAGKHIPSSVKVFLSALAVADDLGAVLVIAFFYSSNLHFIPLFIGAGFLLVLVAGNALGIRRTGFYIIIGFGVWVGFLLSGVHATIAGVLVAFTIPARTIIDERVYSAKLRQLADDFDKEIPNNSTLTTPLQHETIEHIKMLSLAAQTPLQKIEYALHPWVAFVIMPLFALANAGIIIGADFFSALINPVSIGVIAGLLIGKFVGVLLFTWLMVKTGMAGLPQHATWRHIVGVATLAGIGFTMSLFVSALAFKDQIMIDEAKYGILLASLLAGSIGYIILKRTPAIAK
ncbi:Na+/H+ antiporter NhaA [Mucilaginibacter sp. PAMB04168]|uniref:Na+/H+ antiporter NhaA n=1 Tax=Mucilaginibacter sp. PAMB04168 TaxID=3138567 RepID=UPI0031F6C33B